MVPLALTRPLRVPRCGEDPNEKRGGIAATALRRAGDAGRGIGASPSGNGYIWWRLIILQLRIFLPFFHQVLQ